jgi:H+/Cl- antiporter ClcA
MEHLLEHWLELENKDLTRGLVFGLVHVSIMLIGYYSGWSINRMLKLVSNGFIAGIVGVLIAHVLADLIAAYLDPDLRSAAIGIVIGGLLPLPFIPFLEKHVTKSQHHIIIGDHEDVEKDLESKHSHK